MTSIAHASVSIQPSSRSSPVPPPWFGEVALLVSHLRKQNILDAISTQVCFARRRFGHFEVIDFVAVLFGYAVSGERTLEAFYQRLKPYAAAFMALFGRDRLPSRSALSRWLTALDQVAVEALRGLFLSDLLSRPLDSTQQTGGLWDRAGTHYLIFDVDGTREAARRWALPQTPDHPVAQRRLRPLCAPGYLGRKRGEVVRTRTTVLQAHTHHWLGTFGHAGNGEYWAELRRAVTAIHAYLKHHQFPPERAVVRLDGQYGTRAVLADLAGLSYVTRGQDYHLLDRDEVQTRLHLPPDQQVTHPESGITRALYDCPLLPFGAKGQSCRVVVATHPAGELQSRVGRTRAGVVYELFLTPLPPGAFTAADVVALYLHRGAFEPALSDEDQEQDPDRWCSHAAWGQECWQIVSKSGLASAPGAGPPTPAGGSRGPPSLHQLSPRYPPRRPTLRPPHRAIDRQNRVSTGNRAVSLAETLRSSLMAPCAVLPERSFLPPNSVEKRIRACACSMLPGSAIVALVNCESSVSGTAAAPPSRVGSACSCIRWLSPLLPCVFRDWSRRKQRRACIDLVRSQRVEVQVVPYGAPGSPTEAPPLSRPQRAHWRLSWAERLACNARPPTADPVTIRLFGVPAAFAASLGLATG